MSLKSKPEPSLWDSVDYLQTEEDCAEYLNAALEYGDLEVLNLALGDIARARGMTKMSRETGISRDGLYKAFSGAGNPTFQTVTRLLAALGLRLRVEACDPAKAQSA